MSQYAKVTTLGVPHQNGCFDLNTQARKVILVKMRTPWNDKNDYFVLNAQTEEVVLVKMRKPRTTICKKCRWQMYRNRTAVLH